MFYSVDSIEDNIVTLIGYDESKICISLNEIQNDAHEGDIVFKKDNIYCVDYNETTLQKQKTLQLLSNLTKN